MEAPGRLHRLEAAKRTPRTGIAGARIPWQHGSANDPKRPWDRLLAGEGRRTYRGRGGMFRDFLMGFYSRATGRRVCIHLAGCLYGGTGGSETRGEYKSSYKARRQGFAPGISAAGCVVALISSRDSGCRMVLVTIFGLRTATPGLLYVPEPEKRPQGTRIAKLAIRGDRGQTLISGEMA